MHRLGSLFSALLCILFATPAMASTAQQVTKQLGQLESWLEPSPNGEGWKQYLHLDQLKIQLKRGDAADAEQVAEVLARFRGPAPELATSGFVQFADHLAAWQQRLAAGEPTVAPSTTLMTSAVPAIPSFQPITSEQLDAARSDATTATADLHKYLLRRGTSANADAWRKYLKWDAIQAQLQSSQTADSNVLAEAITKFYSGETGLELPQFVRARESLLRYHRLLLAKDNDGIASSYQQQVQQVVDALQQDDVDVADLMTRLNWLDQLGQAAMIVEHARQSYAHPNLYFNVSAATIAREFGEPVSRTTEVNDMILGTHVRGTAHLDGVINARLIPSKHNALMELVLTGTTHSNTVGYNGPVTIRSQGQTSVAATKRLVVDILGLRADPALACCDTRTTICGISTGNRLGRKLIEKIAWKRAGSTKRAAENVASRKAERRVARQFYVSTSERLGSANERLESKIRRPLKTRNLYPRLVKLWTTQQHLKFSAVQALPQQLAAPSLPPEAPTSGMTLQVHESMVLNSAINLMAGFKLTDERAQELAKEATGSVPEELELKQDEDPWAITFDLTQPVRIAFDNNQITIAIRGREFIRGEESVRKTAEIGATYETQIEDGRLKLVRSGEVNVTYPGREGQRLSLTELRNKTFLTNKFEGIFKAELGGDEVKLDGELGQRLSDRQLEHVTADNGWLTMGWK